MSWKGGGSLGAQVRHQCFMGGGNRGGEFGFCNAPSQVNASPFLGGGGASS